MLQGFLMVLALASGYFLQYPLFGKEQMRRRDAKSIGLLSFLLGMGMMFWAVGLIIDYSEYSKGKPVATYEMVLLASPIVIYLTVLVICLRKRKMREKIRKIIGVRYEGKILSGKIYTDEFLSLVENYCPHTEKLKRMGIDEQNKLCKLLNKMGAAWYGVSDISSKTIKIYDAFAMLDLYVFISENNKEKDELIKAIRVKMNDLPLTDEALSKVIDCAVNV